MTRLNSGQSQGFVLHYTSNGKVGLTVTPNQNSYHFLLVTPSDHACALVATRSCDEEGVVRYLGVQVVCDSLEDIDDVHNRIAPVYGFGSDTEFQVHYEDPTVDHALGCQGASVILHTLHLPREGDRDRSRSPRRHVETHPPDAGSDATSLLQTKHVVLRHGSECSSGCELVQRTRYVQRHPQHFCVPMAWTRAFVEAESLPDPVVDILVPAETSTSPQPIAIVIEVISFKTICDHITVGLIAPRCNLAEVCARSGHSVKICLAKRNGVVWSGRTIDWNNGDVLTTYCDDASSFLKAEVSRQNSPHKEHEFGLHAVYFDATCEPLDRIDFVGSTKALGEWCGNDVHLTRAKHHWSQPGSCHNFWLASKNTQDDKVSFLLGVLQPDGKVVWEHRRTKGGSLDQIVPQAGMHSFFCNGAPTSSPSRHPKQDEDVLLCTVRTCRHVCVSQSKEV